MAIGIILGIILILGSIGAFTFMGITWYRGVEVETTNKWGDKNVVTESKFTKKALIFLIFAIVLLIAFVLVPFSFHKVDAGEVAVVKYLGEAKEVKTSGTYWDFWVTKSYAKYDAKVQNVDIETMAYSSDAQTMTVQMTLQYNIQSDHALEIATQYGNLNALQGRIQSIAIEKAKSVLSSHKAMDIIADRASMSPAVEAAIKDAIGNEYYVNIATVVLTNIDFSDAFELAVEEKMIAEQAKLKAEYENETKVAQAQADIAIAQAKADAELKKAQAQIEIEKANAEALKIQAEAEAEANKIISDSITDELIDKIYADNWNGELPDVIGNNDIILPGDILG